MKRTFVKGRGGAASARETWLAMPFKLGGRMTQEEIIKALIALYDVDSVLVV